MGEDDRTRALRLTPVSRETERRLAIYADLLRQWQTVINLVAPNTLPQLWTRHFADSAQLLDAAPSHARRWTDLGSGAGFPGLVIAICLADSPEAHVRLIESDKRKCAFLRTVIRETGACASVVADRIENVVSVQNEPIQPEPIDVITARALAPLPQLLTYSRAAVIRGAVGLFLKGRNLDSELTASADLRSVKIDLVPSRTDSDARIVRVRHLESEDR